MKTTIAVYDDLIQARGAIQELEGAGIKHDQISLVVNDSNGQYKASIDSYMNAKDRAQEITDPMSQGTIAGSLLGGLLGVEAGLIAIAAVGLGSVVAAGGIATILMGGGVGTVVGGLTGALVGMNLNNEEAEFYAEAVRQGAALVAVESSEKMVYGVTTILKKYDPIDIDQRLAQWKEDGWTGPDSPPERVDPLPFPFASGNR